MGYNQPDVYYQPEKLGLKPVAEIDYSSRSYEFDLRVVWLHELTQKLYTARDSGCSCPSPFEDYTCIDSLKEVNLVELETEAQEELRQSTPNVSMSDVSEFLDKVRHAVVTPR